MRIACLSDLHGNLSFTLPPCDLALIAGDVCPDLGMGQGRDVRASLQMDWLMMEFQTWAEEQPCPIILSTFGNHDWLRGGFRRGEKVRFLVDQLASLPPGAPTIYFTPWSPEFCGWSWMKDEEDLEEMYTQIPEGVDILVSHSPPFGVSDLTLSGEHVGSGSLLKAIERVRPKVVVCGHIHEAKGEDVIEHDDGFKTLILNASLLNEFYQMVHAPYILDWDGDKVKLCA